MPTAAPGQEISAPQAYRERLFQLLGDRDPLTVMAQTAFELDSIVRRHPATVLRSRPFEGKWTPNEIIGHLTDSEWVYGYRLRLVLSEDNPPITGTQQERWVSALHYNQAEPAELVQIFRTLRELNLAAWKQISPADLQRSGLHNERGPEPLGVTLRMLAGHDLSHLAQINRYIEAVRES